MSEPTRLLTHRAADIPNPLPPPLAADSAPAAPAAPARMAAHFSPADAIAESLAHLPKVE